MFFSCSIVFLNKQKDKKWHSPIRFDDSHGCRHADIDLQSGKTKIFHEKLILAKIECPILCRIVNSLPKATADEWKINLFKEFLIGNQKYKEYIENPKKIQYY